MTAQMTQMSACAALLAGQQEVAKRHGCHWMSVLNIYKWPLKLDSVDGHLQIIILNPAKKPLMGQIEVVSEVVTLHNTSL